MGLRLGYDGKIRAVHVNCVSSTVSPSYIAIPYVGLLSTLPADYATLPLPQLLDLAGTDNAAFPVGMDSDRKGLGFTTPTTVTAETGAIASNTVGTLSWYNYSAVPVTIEGIFITDVSTGDGGLSLWVGPPDIGSMEISVGDPATIEIDGLELGVK